jgi:hypothetical protein
MEVFMRKNRFTLPIVFASIGALINIVVSYFIAYFATGGAFMNGSFTFDFGDMWLAITIMAMVAPILSLIGSLILSSAPKASGVMFIISALEYLIVSILIPDMSAIPYLLVCSIGAVILLVTGVYCIAVPYVKDATRIEYKHHHVEEKQHSLADSKNH